MRYCVNCGNELNEQAHFCENCGTPIPAAAPPVPTAPTQVTVVREPESERDRAFLETTHRLLRWEKKAWHIAGKVWLIFGIIFAAVMLLFGMIFTLVGIAENEGFFGSFMGGFFGSYGLTLGGIYIALGIVNKKAAARIDFYLERFYQDFSLIRNRCGNVGMMLFNIFLGTMSPVFFIINFVRIKANRATVERIIANQR